MAKQMKKALCVVLSVLLAFSCFAVSAFAYTGYDRDGANDALRVQSVVSVDKSTYAVGDTVTATITLNHPEDTVIGYQGFIAFDSSKLTFKGLALQSGFEYYNETFDPVLNPDNLIAQVDPTALTRGIGGDAFTASTFDDILGYASLSAPTVINLAVLNTQGLPAGSDAVATVTFEAKAAVESLKIALVPSIVYGSAIGYMNCAATTASEGVFETAFSATTPSATFSITGGSGEDTYYDITFSWNGGSEVVSTKEGDTPVAPSVPAYEDGDYDCTFSAWSPALAPASAATTYVAQYDRTFVAANYDAYNAAVAAATAKRDNGTNWTEESVAALNTELAKDVSGLGRTSQAQVDAQTAAINNAADALAEKAAEYTIAFVVNGETVSSQTVTAGAMPTVPSVSDYEDDAKTYHFTGWDKEVVAAAGNTTYTAQFEETWKEYPITFVANGKSEVVNTHWGDIPVAPAVSGYEDDTYTYTFKAWEPQLAACTGATTYTATYDKAYKTFTITFLDEDGTVLSKKEDYHYGDTVTLPDDPTKAADNTYTYTFDGWDKTVAPVSEDAVYTATYKATYIDYTIKFVDHSGEISSQTYHYGETVTAPSVAGYSDETYRYTFKEWDSPVTTVQGDKTYTAVYDKEYIEYNITFNWDNGGTATVTAHWGEMPAAPSVPSYEQGGKTFSFIGWEPALAACAGDATYTARYSSEDIYYNITFIVEGTSATQSVKAGAMPEIPELVDHADPADGDYQISFTGWDAEIVAAAGDATYTAQYTRDFVAADYAAVDNAKAIAAEINRDLYTDESLADLDKALADVVEGLGRTKQAEVNAMAAAIADAADALVFKSADYSSYDAAVTALRAELAKADYTPDSVASVTDKLNTIDNGLDKTLIITQQSVVDDATAAVNALFGELVVKADKGALKALMDEAAALDSSKYVDFSAVESALASAQTVYDNDNATNEEVAGAITALRAALNNLIKKDADYSAWNALETQFAAVKTQYYTPASVAAVEEVLAKVVKGQDIEYQADLDALTQELQAAMDSLELIKSWAGETDWEGIEHPYFYSNLEFEQEIDEQDPTNITVKVYLNHPVDAVDGIQIAALYDAQAMTFQSVDINEGTLVYAEAADASFDPADFELDAMAKASVVKFVADFDAVLAPTEASRDLVATLHFTATGAQDSSYIKAVPLASNTAVAKSVYSALINDETEAFMHNDAANLVLAEVESGTVSGTLTGDNMSAPITLTLSNETNSYEVVVKGKSADYSFENVLPGTYTLQMSAVGSLGYTIKNVVVTAGTNKEIENVYLLFGDCNEDGAITGQDVGILLNAYGSSVAACDVDGNGTVTGQDLGIIILASHFGVSASMQVKTLD